jgi:hypothetical protein
MPTFPTVGKRADPLRQMVAKHRREKAAYCPEKTDQLPTMDAADVLIYQAYLAAQTDKQPH